MGVSELLYLSTPAHAAINESVSLCKSIGREGLCSFVNAVLRKIERASNHLPPLPTETSARLSIQYSYPEWLVCEWLTNYGDSFTEALLAAAPSPLELRAQYPCTTEALIDELSVPIERGKLDQNCLRVSSGFDVGMHPAFIEGRMSVQSQSAMLCCRSVAECRGKRVLDVCAAPGGKSAYLASLCQNDISLTCWELHPHRKLLLDHTLDRLHVRAHTELRDATTHDARYNDSFDFVLLDAPCSALGQTNSKPDIRYAKTDADIVDLCSLQRNLLDVCSSYVRPGGVLLYATCTISMRENEEQASSFLARHKNFVTEPLPLPVENSGQLQLFPHIHDTSGFFMARYRRCI